MLLILKTSVTQQGRKGRGGVVVERYTLRAFSPMILSLLTSCSLEAFVLSILASPGVEGGGNNVLKKEAR